MIIESSLLPREKLLHHGSRALTDVELLAVFYRVGLPGKSVLNLAQEHLIAAGSLQKLLDMPFNEIQAWGGVGLSKYASLQAALELGKRYLNQTLKNNVPMNHVSKVVDYLNLQLRNLDHEVIVGLFLDTKNGLIASAELARGGLSSTQLYPRTLIKQALNYNAAGLIVAHNHPSGDPTPSQADKTLTNALKKLLEQIEIRLLDHIILGNACYFSFAEKGCL